MSRALLFVAVSLLAGCGRKSDAGVTSRQSRDVSLFCVRGVTYFVTSSGGYGWLTELLVDRSGRPVPCEGGAQ